MLAHHTLHVIQRGNNRRTCFESESDYLVYLALLRSLAPESKCAIHAYCLMTNHIHLLLTPEREGSCARLMHGVGQRYATYFNRRYKRSGTLWEGRFRSCLVGNGEYVLACHRYIEMNPVRAGMARDPASYPWSSFASNSGIRPDPLLSRHSDMSAIGAEGYRQMFESDLPDALVAAIRETVNCGYPLGNESFKHSVALATGREVEKRRPGPKTTEARERSVAVPDLFSGGGVS